MKIPFPLLTDSYKVTHGRIMPDGLEAMYSYFESRGGQFKETVFTGLQGILLEHLAGTVVTKSGLDRAQARLTKHFGKDIMDRDAWTHVLYDHEGKLPLSIRAVPEGSVVPTGNVLMTVENTCSRCAWLTNYVETLLVQVWYPSTVATISREAKKILHRYLERTGDPGLIDYKLHDFGFRGVSSVESACIGGCAHLVNFKGTDTLPALEYADLYYNEPDAGHSIPATEHSVVTINGPDGELEMFKRVLDSYPDMMVACVSDSYNVMKACTEMWGDALKVQVMGREHALVVRPDSGYPPKVVLEVVQRLGDAFGYKTNQKGYKVLDPHVRVIQGDGVNLGTIEECLHQLQFHGWSADNLTFGMGGALLQKCDRDTSKYAFKCSSRTIDGVEAPVWKEPITDPGKMSKRGRLKLVMNLDGDDYVTVAADAFQAEPDVLEEVFRDGRLVIDQKLSDIRQRAALSQPVAV